MGLGRVGGQPRLPTPRRGSERDQLGTRATGEVTDVHPGEHAVIGSQHRCSYRVNTVLVRTGVGVRAWPAHATLDGHLADRKRGSQANWSTRSARRIALERAADSVARAGDRLPCAREIRKGWKSRLSTICVNQDVPAAEHVAAVRHSGISTWNVWCSLVASGYIHDGVAGPVCGDQKIAPGGSNDLR